MKRLKEQIEKNLHGNDFYSWFPVLLLLFSLYLVYLVINPFLHTIIVSIVLAAVFQPLYTLLRKRLGRSIPAALIVVLIIVVCILIPAALFLLGLVGQGVETLTRLNEWIRTNDLTALLDHGGLDPYIDWLKEKLPFIDLETLNLQSKLIALSQATGQYLLSFSTVILSNVMSLSLRFLLMIFILFYLLKDGQAMVSKIKYLVPLRDTQSEAILESLRNISKAVLVGGLLVAVLQGVVGGIGLAIIGIPALFWGTMVAFTSLVPVFGTGLIWLPAAIYLVLVGEWKSALFLAGWFVIIVVQIDTFLRPLFMRGAARVSIFYIFFAVIGGVKVFGPLGILYGPLILSFVIAMLKIYGEEFKEVLGSKNSHS